MNILGRVKILCIVVGSIALAPIVAGLEITVTYTDDPGPSPPLTGEGFLDLVVGAQRRAAFEYAVSIWEAHLDGTIPLQIEAQFNRPS